MSDQIIDLLPRPAGSPIERMPSSMWMTSALRPAGSFDDEGAQRLVTALGIAAETAQVVLLDLEAVPELPREVRRAMERAHRRLLALDGALLVFDPGHRHDLPEGVAAVDRMPLGF